MASRRITAAAQRFRGLAWCCAVLGATAGGQQAMAQDAPLFCVVVVEADTGAVHAVGDFSRGGMLVGADKDTP